VHLQQLVFNNFEHRLLRRDTKIGRAALSLLFQLLLDLQKELRNLQLQTSLVKKKETGKNNCNNHHTEA